MASRNNNNNNNNSGGRGHRDQNAPASDDLEFAQAFWSELQRTPEPQKRYLRQISSIHKRFVPSWERERAKRAPEFRTVIDQLKAMRVLLTIDRLSRPLFASTNLPPRQRPQERRVDSGFSNGHGGVTVSLVDEQARTIQPGATIQTSNGSDYPFQLRIDNNSEVDRTFRCRYLSRNASIEVKHIDQLISLPKQHEVALRGTLKTREPGVAQSHLLFVFSSFSFPFELSFNLLDEKAQRLAPTSPYTPPERTLEESNESEIVPGEKPDYGSTSEIVPPAFKLPFFEVPNHMKTCFQNNQLALLKLKPLEQHTYLHNFETLLWVEELQMDLDIRAFDLQNVLLVSSKGSKLLRLSVPGLAEKRPSVLYGDKVFATKTKESDKRRYEGYVHAIRLNDVDLGFNSDFAREYQQIPVPVNIRFSYSRYPLRWFHWAVKKVFELNQKKSSSVFFPRGPDSKLYIPENQPTAAFNRNLNPEQKSAVEYILKGLYTPSPYILFGPPGTGKTITVVEAILQLYKYTRAVILACAPSNSAADLLVERLQEKIPVKEMFRLNAYQRDTSTVSEAVKKYSLQSPSGRFGIKNKIELEKEVRVVVSTCVSVGQLHFLGLTPGHFSHIFIDEAGQSTEPESMVPLVFATNSTRVILAGDPKQLGPVIRSPFAANHQLGLSFLERLINTPIYTPYKEGEMRNPKVITKLLRNYRNNQHILSLPSRLFYQNELIPCADPMLQEALLTWNQLPNNKVPILFHGIQGIEQREGKSPSWFNVQEATMVLAYINSLTRDNLRLRVEYNQIGVIAPYRQQVSKIRQLLGRQLAEIKVGSVEEFQGQERKVIIISTVRSVESAETIKHDLKHNLGFLRNPKRFNVAITRAQSLLIVIGNPRVLVHDPQWRAFLKHCQIYNAHKGSVPIPPIPDDPQTPVDPDSEISQLIAQLSIVDSNTVAVNVEQEWRTDGQN